MGPTGSKSIALIGIERIIIFSLVVKILYCNSIMYERSYFTMLLYYLPVKPTVQHIMSMLSFGTIYKLLLMNFIAIIILSILNFIPHEQVSSLSVVGAGQMGTGIALVAAATAKIPNVTLMDVQKQSLGRS